MRYYSRMPRFSNLAWPLILLLFAAACKEASSPESTSLSAPERTSAAGIAGNEAVAEATVTASSGPIELSLLLHSKKVRVGDSFWYKLRIRNRGTTAITLVENALTDPFRFYKELDGRFGLYLEVLGPDGKALPVRVPRLEADDYANDRTQVSGLLEGESAEEKGLVARWKDEGLDDSAIRRKLLEHNIKRLPIVSTPALVLQQGEAVETHSWFHHGVRERTLKRPQTRPIGDFSELEFFHLEQPGTYKLRAVFDQRPSPNQLKSWSATGLPRPAEWVFTRTPWIEAHVTP